MLTNKGISWDTLFETHNLEVLGSSPSWSTLKSSTYEQSQVPFSFIGDLFETKLISRDLLKSHEMISC